ncbi:MAG: class I SAM-dependent methyltransferase [Actinomycetota bacterium]|nr:class I SAM-dependent methyltransferase [Actinomycetota bacterium]MDQ5808288.1 class I SAM-dependent methyltransferase [Actinomycetota bacterium]
MPRTALRRAYHRLWWAPRARSALRGDLFRRDALDVTHLHAFPEGGARVGPVQREEALVLYALVRAVRPRTVVEFGFHDGRSAFNLVRALDPDARLYTYDIGAASARVAEQLFGHDDRVRFHLKSQAEFEPADVDGREVDFVFLDASHDLALNQETFRRVLPVLAPDALVAVHDTGTVPRALLTPGQLAEVEAAWSHQWVTPDAFEHQPGERATLNWLRDEHPEFAQVNLHTHRVVRWGLTLLQRSARLETVHP